MKNDEKIKYKKYKKYIDQLIDIIDQEVLKNVNDEIESLIIGRDILLDIQKNNKKERIEEILELEKSVEE